MVVFPAPDGPTRATSWPGWAGNDTSNSTWLRRGLLEHGHRLERGQRHLLGARVAEVDVVELDRGGTAGDGDGVGLLVDHGRQVEDLEHPVERHQGRHDVDLHVRQRRRAARRGGSGTRSGRRRSPTMSVPRSASTPPQP